MTDKSGVSVAVLVGPRGAQQSVRGRVRLTPSAFVELRALVPGGDPHTPRDRFKRFRAFLTSVAGADRHSVHGSGTSFHPRHLPAFLTRFGASPEENAPALARVASWVARCETRRSGHAEQYAMTDREREVARAAAAHVLRVLLPLHSITNNELAWRLGVPMRDGEDRGVWLRRARARFHPDATARTMAPGEDVTICAEARQEIFKRIPTAREI